MIFPIGFTRHGDFLLFKKAIRHPSALEFLLNLFEGCRSRVSAQLFLPLDEISAIMILPQELDGAVVRNALEQCGMITPIPGEEDLYEATLFITSNPKYISDVVNGRKGGRPPKNASVKASTSSQVAAPPRSIQSAAAPSLRPQASASLAVQEMDEDVPF